MVGDHSGWIAVLEVPGIPQIWVEEWIGKSATITKIPDLDGFGREPRGECLRPIWGSFLHPIGSTWATETPWQVFRTQSQLSTFRRGPNPTGSGSEKSLKPPE